MHLFSKLSANVITYQHRLLPSHLSSELNPNEFPLLQGLPPHDRRHSHSIPNATPISEYNLQSSFYNKYHRFWISD